jgi:hypothetical protein
MNGTAWPGERRSAAGPVFDCGLDGQLSLEGGLAWYVSSGAAPL